MLRRMTLVVLAMALFTTLAAPVAWGQGQLGTNEMRDVVDPNGSSLKAPANPIYKLDWTSPSGRIAELSSQPRTQAAESHSLEANQLTLSLSLLKRFLFQAVGL